MFSLPSTSNQKLVSSVSQYKLHKENGVFLFLSLKTVPSIFKYRKATLRIMEGLFASIIIYIILLLLQECLSHFLSA